jgi:hypothetical protein
MAKKSIRDEQKRTLWKRHLEEWSRSGSTQVEYCRRHKLSTKSFTYWKRRFRQKSAVSFVPVQVKAEAPVSADTPSGLVLCKEGYRIEIREGFNVEALGRVLRTLEDLSC